MARGKIVGDTGAAGESGGTDARGPDGEDGFVVIDDDFVEPGDDELNQPSLSVEDTAAGQDAAPFSPAAFPALGASLSARVASSPTATRQQQPGGNPAGFPSNPSSIDDTAPRFDAAAAAVIAAVDLVYKFLYAHAVIAYRFLNAHGGVVFDFLYAHALVVFEFVYAYAVVAVQETLAILEKVWSRVRPTWRRWRENGPAPVKRVVKHRLFPVAVAVALSMLLVLPAYWAIPRGGGSSGGGGASDGQGRLSTRQWQAKYDILNSKYSADLVRQRLKYDSLAGRHLELQSEYESLLKDYKNQQRVARVNRNGPKSPPETCDKADSVLGPVKEALKVAEQSAYEYFSHFSEGLRKDVHEIAERCLGNTGDKGGEGDGGGSGELSSDRDDNTSSSPIDDERKDRSNSCGSDGGGIENAVVAIEQSDAHNTNSPIDVESKSSSNDGGGSGGDGETDSPAPAFEEADTPADSAEVEKHGDAGIQPVAEQKKVEDGFQSQQQVPVQQQVEQMERIEAARRRARGAHGGIKGHRHVGWAFKIDNARGRSLTQYVRDLSTERTDGQASELSSSADMEQKVGGKNIDEAEKADDDGKIDGARGIDDDEKKTSDVKSSDPVAAVFDETVQDVNVTNDADTVGDVDLGKQVANYKRAVRRSEGSDERSLPNKHGSDGGRDLGKEEDEIAMDSVNYSALLKQVRALVMARNTVSVELGDGDPTEAPNDSGAKTFKPDEANSEDVKLVDEQQQTSTSHKVTGKLWTAGPHDSKEVGTAKAFVKIEEEEEPEGSTAGGKRKSSKQKDVVPRDGEKGRKDGKRKEKSIKGEEDKPEKKKNKKNKGGKSKEKNKE